MSDRYAGPDGCLPAAAFSWWYMPQSDRNVLVSGMLAVHIASEQHVWVHRHNQTDII